MNEKPGIAQSWIALVRRWKYVIVAAMMLWSLILLGIRLIAGR